MKIPLSNPLSRTFYRTLYPGLLLLFLLLPATMVLAQKEMSENQSTEQPGFYIGPYTLYPGNFQVESTLSLDQMRYRSDPVISNLAMPAVLARYGLTDRLELRVQSGLGYANYRFGTSSTSDFGLLPVTLGGKVQVIDPGQSLPPLALRVHLGLPKIKTGLYPSPDFLAPSFLLTTSTPFLADYTAYLNLGIAWNGFGPEPTYQYALAVERILAQGLTAYGELYGFIPTSGDLDHRYDLGLLYVLSPDLQADFSGGVGFMGQFTTWFVSGGFSFRMVPARNQ